MLKQPETIEKPVSKRERKERPKKQMKEEKAEKSRTFDKLGAEVA